MRATRVGFYGGKQIAGQYSTPEIELTSNNGLRADEIVLYDAL